MKTYLVVTITCPDRPGIVELVTEQVLSHSANWEDSRMARLGGDFAGIVLLSVGQQQTDPLTQALLALADDVTTVTVKVAQQNPSIPPADNQLLVLTLSGADHEGIVHTVSTYLAQQGVNVESLDTYVVPAPITASPLFHMNALVKLPPELLMADLADNLHRIGDDLGVDIEVRPHED